MSYSILVNGEPKGIITPFKGQLPIKVCDKGILYLFIYSFFMHKD